MIKTNARKDNKRALLVTTMSRFKLIF